jgi:plasmid stability protein
MELSKIIDAQVAFPTELYRVIQQRAEIHGCSINSEIVALLTASLKIEQEKLTQELEMWEAASDEDWLATEMIFN